MLEGIELIKAEIAHVEQALADGLSKESAGKSSEKVENRVG